MQVQLRCEEHHVGVTEFARICWSCRTHSRFQISLRWMAASCKRVSHSFRTSDFSWMYFLPISDFRNEPSVVCNFVVVLSTRDLGVLRIQFTRDSRTVLTIANRCLLITCVVARTIPHLYTWNACDVSSSNFQVFGNWSRFSSKSSLPLLTLELFDEDIPADVGLHGFCCDLLTGAIHQIASLLMSSFLRSSLSFVNIAVLSWHLCRVSDARVYGIKLLSFISKLPQLLGIVVNTVSISETLEDCRVLVSLCVGAKWSVSWNAGSNLVSGRESASRPILPCGIAECEVDCSYGSLWSMLHFDARTRPQTDVRCCVVETNVRSNHVAMWQSYECGRAGDVGCQQGAVCDHQFRRQRRPLELMTPGTNQWEHAVRWSGLPRGLAAVFQGRNHSFHPLQGTHFPWRSLSHVRWRWQRLRRQNWEPHVEHAERVLVRQAQRQGRLLGLFHKWTLSVRSSFHAFPVGPPLSRPRMVACFRCCQLAGRVSMDDFAVSPSWRSSGRQLPRARSRFPGTSPASLLEHRWFSLAWARSQGRPWGVVHGTRRGRAIPRALLEGRRAYYPLSDGVPRMMRVPCIARCSPWEVLPFVFARVKVQSSCHSAGCRWCAERVEGAEQSAPDECSISSARCKSPACRVRPPRLGTMQPIAIPVLARGRRVCTKVSAVCYRFPRHRSWHMRRRWHCFAHPESAPTGRACNECVRPPCAPPGTSAECTTWGGAASPSAPPDLVVGHHRAARLGRVHSQGRPHTAIRSHAPCLACAGRGCRIGARIFTLLRVQPSPMEALFLSAWMSPKGHPFWKRGRPRDGCSGWRVSENVLGAVAARARSQLLSGSALGLRAPSACLRLAFGRTSAAGARPLKLASTFVAWVKKNAVATEHKVSGVTASRNWWDSPVPRRPTSRIVTRGMFGSRPFPGSQPPVDHLSFFLWFVGEEVLGAVVARAWTRFCVLARKIRAPSACLWPDPLCSDQTFEVGIDNRWTVKLKEAVTFSSQ